MSQTRNFQWKDDDLTRFMNQHMLGIIEPGVYRGFRLAGALPMGLNLTLSHGTDWYGPNGATESSYDDPPTVNSSIGVIFSKQGVVIKETAPIVLPISAGDDTYGRIDLIVCRSKYVQITGGTEAEYVVYEGTPSASPVPPTLSFPAQEIILGSLLMGAGATDLNSGHNLWTPVFPPPLGNQLATMFTDRYQISTALKVFEEIGFTTGEASTVSTDTVLVDTLAPSTGAWTDENATQLVLTCGSEDAYLFTNVAAHLANRRMLIFRMAGVGSKKVEFHYDNFTQEQLHNHPWESSSVNYKHLRVFDGDVVCMVGRNDAGTLWDVLWVKSTKALQANRRVTMEDSFLLSTGTLLSTGLFDWKANCIDISSSSNYTLGSLNPAGLASDGVTVIQENNLPIGYEIQVRPLYTGATIMTHIFKVTTSGNILTHNDQPVILPWGRPATFISINTADGVKWMLKDYQHGMMLDVTSVYTADNGNLGTNTGGASVVFDTITSSHKVFTSFSGVRTVMSFVVPLVMTGSPTSILVALPAGVTIRDTGTTQVTLVCGHGILGEDAVLCIYGSTSYSGKILVAKYDSSPMTSGTLRISVDVESFPSIT